MPSTFSPAAYAVSTLSFIAAVTSAHSHDRSLLSRPQGTLRARQGLNTMTYVGCFSSSAGFSDQGGYQYQTSGYCQGICVGKNQAVLALSNGSDCWCGDTLPQSDGKVDDSQCNSPCNGFGSDSCGGGTNFFSVYTTGTEAEGDISTYGGGSSSGNSASSASSSTKPSTAASTPSTTAAPSSTTPTTSATPIVVTSVAPGHTVIITQPAAQASGTDASPTPSEHKSGSNVAGVAAGAVVGVLAALAIIGGLIFWLRRRRNQAAEDEYKRSNQVGDFMRGGSEIKPPPTAYSQMSDSRLDPTAGKRNSAGSIADAEDYSRRILRVANPDGH